MDRSCDKDKFKDAEHPDQPNLDDFTETPAYKKIREEYRKWIEGDDRPRSITPESTEWTMKHTRQESTAPTIQVNLLH